MELLGRTGVSCVALRCGLRAGARGVEAARAARRERESHAAAVARPALAALDAGAPGAGRSICSARASVCVGVWCGCSLCRAGCGGVELPSYLC